MSADSPSMLPSSTGPAFAHVRPDHGTAAFKDRSRGAKVLDILGDRCIQPQLPEEYLRYVTEQDYEAYESRGPHEVWRRVMQQNLASFDALESHIYRPYLDGFWELGLDPTHLPSIQSISRRLAKIGWRAVCVDGYIPPRVYFGMLALQIFPIARHVRSLEHLEYSPTPDLIHDIFGHLPLLMCREHREYLQLLASIAARATATRADREYFALNRELSALKGQLSPEHPRVLAGERALADLQVRLASNPSDMTRVARIFLWSIEFGLVGDVKDYLLHGAALLSSLRESRAVLESGANVVPYSREVAERDILFSDLQQQYFVFSSYQQLTDVLLHCAESMQGYSEAWSDVG